MSHVVSDTLSLKRFLRLPEAKPALEYLQGKVVQKVSPKAIHSRIQYKFLMRLSAFAEPLELGEPYPELRCTFAGESFVPDIAFFAPGRMPRDAKGRLVDDVMVPRTDIIAVQQDGPGRDLDAQWGGCLAGLGEDVPAGRGRADRGAQQARVGGGVHGVERTGSQRGDPVGGVVRVDVARGVVAGRDGDAGDARAVAHGADNAVGALAEQVSGQAVDRTVHGEPP